MFHHLAYMGLVQIIMLGSFFTGVFYFSLYDNGSNINQKIKETKTKIEEVSASLSKEQANLKNAIEFKEKAERDGDLVQSFLNYLPNQQTAIDIFGFITKEAKVAGIDIMSKRDNGVYEMKNYDALKVNLRVKGSFSQVLFFLSRLTHQKRIMVIENIDINIPNTSSKQIQASMNIYAYRYKVSSKEKEDK